MRGGGAPSLFYTPLQPRYMWFSANVPGWRGARGEVSTRELNANKMTNLVQGHAPRDFRKKAEDIFELLFQPCQVFLQPAQGSLGSANLVLLPAPLK